MADQQYRRPSSPERTDRTFSDASISLSPFGGTAPGSALGQSSDLLGLPVPTSMSDGFSVPRTLLPTSGYTARGSDNLYNTGIYLDGDSDQQQSPSGNSAIQWSSNYSLEPSSTNITAASAIPINRFQSEQQPSWDPLRLAPPLGPTSGTPHTPRNLGQRPGRNNRFLPGPGSDLVSRTNETDEGYYTNSQPDAQSVRSTGQWNMNQDRPNMQNKQMVAPLTYTQPAPRNPGAERPDSDILHDQVNNSHAIQSQHRSDSLACEHEDCGYVSRTQSDFKKHAARHRKEHVCREPGCQRTEGFATINDLERHQKTVHKIQPEHGQSKEYKCFGDSCPKHEKEWPRFDNFKQHLKRMHSGESLEILINKSNEWYKQHKKPQTKTLDQPTQRPSSVNSQQATTQTTAPMGAPSLPSGHRNQRMISTGSREDTIVGPSRAFGTTYPQSEFGNYSTSFSGSTTSQRMSRLSTSQIQLRSNPPQCPFPPCSHTFVTSDHIKEHLQSQQGSQNIVRPYYQGVQAQGSSWHRSQSNPGNQPGLPSRQYMGMQESPGNAMRTQSSYQPQARGMDGGYGPRTAPNPSIPTIQNRLEEDFENSTLMQSQEPIFATESTDSYLVQIGMMDQLQPDLSQNANLGFDTSQEQALKVQEEQQKKPTSPLSFHTIKSFLQKHFPDDRIDFAASAVQGALKSLQSTSSSGDVDNAPAPAPALDTANFERATRNGKAVYLCPFHGCEKYMPRKCELRKHYQRHTLPWACTFDRCRRTYKSFGSKNDWKRHEAKLHEQQETWRCEEQESNISGRSVPATGDDDACMKIFCNKDLYLKHLKDQHRISDSSTTHKLCRSQRIGAKCQGRYWCGFCNKIIEMKAIGVDGESERFNHIDDHFTKERRHIKSWKPLNGRPSAGDSALASGQTSPTEGSCAGSDEVETNEDVAADALATQNTPTPQGSRKRPASTMTGGSQAPVPKVARLSAPRHQRVITQMVKCCGCGDVFQYWNGSCTACNHRVCQNCFAEVVVERDEST